MKIKDTAEISSIISRNSDRSQLGYGWNSYIIENIWLYFLLVTKDKKGEELPQYFWDLEEPEINWLTSKGVELTPY